MKKKKSTQLNKQTWRRAGVFVLIGLSLFTFLYLANIARNIESDQEKISVKIDELMSALVARDIERAYSMFAPRARDDELRHSLMAMNDEVNYAVLDSYDRIEIVRLTVGPVFNAEVRGTVARAEGTIHYTNDYIGEFSAELLPDGEDWGLMMFHPKAPAAKYQAYFNREE